MFGWVFLNSKIYIVIYYREFNIFSSEKFEYNIFFNKKFMIGVK